MSADGAQVLAAEGEGGCHLFSGCGFPAPGVELFQWQPIFTIPGIELGVTKPMLLAFTSSFIVMGFFWAAFSKPKLVPGKLQLVGEMAYNGIKSGISREVIGKKGDQFVPFLVALFFFVWIMNLMSIIPLAQFPVTSRIAFPAALALMVWLVYMGIGFKRHGLHYIKMLCVPSGVPKAMLLILVPIELLQNVVTRPFTLAIRLFANMFAGHILLTLFAVAAWYLFSPSIGLVFSAASFVMTVVLTGFEMFIQALQAYIFTLLTASYISGALEEAH